MANLHSYALTTLADVKESLGIDAGDTTSDNLLIRKINQATDMIEAFCGKNNGQHFASTTYTDEEYNGSGTSQLVLRNRPVITFTNLSERDTTENENSWNTVDSELYFVDNYPGVIESVFTFNRHYNLYKATYTAGFETIPSDLAEACVSLAVALYENSATGTGVKRKSQGPKEIEYFQPQQGGSLIESIGIDDTLARYTDLAILDDR